MKKFTKMKMMIRLIMMKKMLQCQSSSPWPPHSVKVTMMTKIQKDNGDIDGKYDNVDNDKNAISDMDVTPWCCIVGWDGIGVG